MDKDTKINNPAMDSKILVKLRKDDRDKFKAIAAKNHFTMVSYLRRMILETILKDEILEKQKQSNQENIQ